MLTDGRLDTSFHTDGMNSVNTLNDAPARPVFADSGLIWIFGGDNADFVLGRVKTNGSYDTSFHTDGFTQTNMSNQDRGYSLVKLPDGRLCGVGGVNNVSDFGITCYQQ